VEQIAKGLANSNIHIPFEPKSRTVSINLLL
jgi:hypothetical protein